MNTSPHLEEKNDSVNFTLSQIFRESTWVLTEIALVLILKFVGVSRWYVIKFKLPEVFLR